MGSVVPVILSGGSGTRLWPLSRSLYPKQLLPLASERSMLQETLLRVGGDDFSSPIIICNEEHRFIVAEQLRGLGATSQAIVLEPEGRNTAPAAAVGALMALRNDPDAVILLLPSDHVIGDKGSFRKASAAGVKAAQAGAIVTFGVTPSRPDTGYGYMKRGVALEGAEGCFAIEKFVEKPDRATAESYLADGLYYWNSGMFLFSARRYLDELARLHPGTLTACEEAIANGREDLDFFRLDETAFKRAKSESIDYAIMEHTKIAAVVPADMQWNDVGSWLSLWDIGQKDGCGNVIDGNIVAIDVKNSYLRSENQVVAVIGIDGLVVVATDDAVLVAPKDKAQEVKSLVEQIRKEGRQEHESHVRVQRPWGWYQTLDLGERFHVKQICVNPQAKLSLQSHRHRAEHWVVVEGTARVSRDGETLDLVENQSTYIPIGMKHRLENPKDSPLRIIEVQSGDYLGEDDIVRFEDSYGRR
ncbi:MAG: mannose-1-phosphate guanylyltransferase/mannose-6-phosphate isomerase [Rhodospirillales bacterium]|nr:mannose-1-phosphate guanylyltransferase/mannose-6-phosphate isomerase [Rhodospirillales bacterium]